MSKSITLYVRGAFALILLGLGMYAGAERLVAHEMAGRGLSTCGSADHPCELATLTVTVERAAVAAAEPAENTALQVMRAAPRAPRAHPVATAES